MLVEIISYLTAKQQFFAIFTLKKKQKKTLNKKKK